MKIRTLLLYSIFILYFGASLKAQNESARSERLKIENADLPKTSKDSIHWARHKINFTPVSLFSTYHPGIELGYERLHGKRFATEYHFMLLTSLDNEYARESQGFMLGFELKYFHINTRNMRFYYALALEAMEKTHTAELHYAMPAEDGYTLRDRKDYFTRVVDVNKTFFTTTLRVGMQYYVTRKLILEGYAGIGRRHRNVSHLNPPTTNSLHSRRDYLGLDLEYPSNRAIVERVAKFDLNVRLAWTF